MSDRYSIAYLYYWLYPCCSNDQAARRRVQNILKLASHDKELTGYLSAVEALIRIEEGQRGEMWLCAEKFGGCQIKKAQASRLASLARIPLRVLAKRLLVGLFRCPPRSWWRLPDARY